MIALLCPGDSARFIWDSHAFPGDTPDIQLILDLPQAVLVPQ
jgi:hypothetical protein